MKKIVKKIICFFLRILIPFVSLFSKKISEEKLKEYEHDIRKIYNPKPYIYKKPTNKHIDKNIDLSIIIPIYNSEKYLKECIDSILNNKTKYNYEILVINDGSTDSSLKILKEYKDKRIKIINQKNGGAAKARNNGLDNAVGKYISFIDSDDFIKENYIETLMNEAISYDADIVKCGYYTKYDNFLENNYGIVYRNNNGLGNDILKIEGFLWMSVIKRSILYDIRLPEGYWYEDMVMRSLIFPTCKKVIGIKDCLYYYRQHDNNISKTVEHSINYKCLSQYYLPRYIYQYAKNINLKIDNIYKQVLLNELEVISYTRLNKLPLKIKKKIFYLNSKFIKNLELNYNEIKNKKDKLFYRSYIKNNYLLYKILSLYNKWNVE